MAVNPITRIPVKVLQSATQTLNGIREQKGRLSKKALVLLRSVVMGTCIGETVELRVGGDAGLLVGSIVGGKETVLLRE